VRDLLLAGPVSHLCAWCGAPADGSERLPGRRRCRECGAATIDPWPSEEELDRAYGDWYRPPSGRRFAPGGDALLRWTRASLARRLDRIAPPGPVLDVGAGEGVLVAALQRRGREAVGVERGDEGLDRLGDGWAAVVFWHSLEHLPEPGAAIRRAARLLVPGGVVVVAVPDSDSLQAGAFGDRWLHLDPPRHLVHLTTEALTAGLERCGFAVERVSRVRGGQIAIGWLDGLVGSLPGGLDLYQSLRSAPARSAPVSGGRRAAALGAGALLAPVALACAGAEVALGRSGVVYVEARRA
jgi:SAM-dependent methyltransferase